jgi:hypothetical protein
MCQEWPHRSHRSGTGTGGPDYTLAVAAILCGTVELFNRTFPTVPFEVWSE